MIYYKQQSFILSFWVECHWSTLTWSNWWAVDLLHRLPEEGRAIPWEATAGETGRKWPRALKSQATSGSKRFLEGRISQTCWWDMSCLTQHWYFLFVYSCLGLFVCFLGVGDHALLEIQEHFWLCALHCFWQFSTYCETLRQLPEQKEEATLERHASGTDFFGTDSGLYLHGKKGIFC